MSKTHFQNMKNYGFIRVAACSPVVRPGDISHNIGEIERLAAECDALEADIALFPELSITGYTCADLFGQALLLEKAQTALSELASRLSGKKMTVVVGVPVTHDGRLFNCAAVLSQGNVRGLVPKSYIPDYGEFYEKRWFVSGHGLSTELFSPGSKESVPFGTDLIFETAGAKFGIEICEDLWVPLPPSSELAPAGADIILNLSATNELIGKHRYLTDLIANQSARCRSGYVYASAGTGESSTDLAFAGNCIIAENGIILAESERFTLADKLAIADIDVETIRHDRMHFGTFHECDRDNRYRTVHLDNPIRDKQAVLRHRRVDAHPFLDGDERRLAARCAEISSIQAWGLAIRLRAINCSKAVIGISGGLDSTLALLVTVKAFDMLGLDRKGIIAITMPGFGTTDRTKSNASRLMELLGVTEREIPIADAVRQHFSAIGHDPRVHDVTYENSQARERTQILMDVANNENAIVIGTGDLSELALGWCTYNGDQMSMYGVNASIPKTLVSYLVHGYAVEAGNEGNTDLAHVLEDIIDTPISPELLPPDAQDRIQQKTEDLVGPYELHDFFLYHMLRFGSGPRKIYALALKAFKGVYDAATIKHWLRTFYRRFFSQQFKRSCMPDGVKAGSVCLSPRGDWRMPSDASAALWLTEVDKI